MSELEQRAVNRVVTQARAAGVPIPSEVLGLQSALEHGNGYQWRTYVELHPDFTEGEHPACCYGVVIYGPARCTCWEPVFDVDQADPQLPANVADADTRPRRCGDCAFRRDSPERSEVYTEEELLGLADRGDPFWCHDGMRRPIAYRHPDLGDVPASPDDWQPPTAGGVPFRADGRPGLLCAGWAAERRRRAGAA